MFVVNSEYLISKATFFRQMSRQNVPAVVSTHCSSKKIVCPQYNTVDIIIRNVLTSLVLSVFMSSCVRYVERNDEKRHFVEWEFL